MGEDTGDLTIRSIKTGGYGQKVIPIRYNHGQKVITNKFINTIYSIWAEGYTNTCTHRQVSILYI